MKKAKRHRHSREDWWLLQYASPSRLEWCRVCGAVRAYYTETLTAEDSPMGWTRWTIPAQREEGRDGKA